MSDFHNPFWFEIDCVTYSYDDIAIKIRDAKAVKNHVLAQRLEQERKKHRQWQENRRVKT